jgi:ribA/ribD-fused uncharacterized protein
MIITEFRGEFYFLSSFYMKDVWYRGVVYKSAEHAFHVDKTEDPQAQAWIAAADTPSEAKRRGRMVPLRPYWHQYHRYLSMESILISKFYPTLLEAQLLLGTGEAMPIEGNKWHDNTWGDCYCGRASCREPGLNLLGYMLMRQRAYLKTGATND